MNSELEDALEKGAERIKKAFIQSGVATLEREKAESRVFARLKIEHPEASATELKYMLLGDAERCIAVREEISFLAELKAAEETHMSNKKLATLRGSF